MNPLYNRDLMKLTEKHLVGDVVFKRNVEVPHTHVVLIRSAPEGLWGVASWHYSPITALHAAAAYEGLMGFVAKVEPVNHGKAGA